MIPSRTLQSAMLETIRLAVTRLPPDVERALMSVLDQEKETTAQHHLKMVLENARLASKCEGLICADTGYPLFFATIPQGVVLQGGMTTLFEAARGATEEATQQHLLRPTMVDPITRSSNSTNTGRGMPKVELRFVDRPGPLELLVAPKGGGSEIFGTQFRMLFPADGVEGIMAFVLDSIIEGCYAGKICPPAIIGVGIGGTADLCMQLAKQAALLRPVGSRNPIEALDRFEQQLLSAVNSLGIGPMGGYGQHAAMAVHFATSLTHTAALPVAVNAQCMIGRRWKATIDANGQTRYTGELPWPPQ